MASPIAMRPCVGCGAPNLPLAQRCGACGRDPHAPPPPDDRARASGGLASRLALLVVLPLVGAAAGLAFVLTQPAGADPAQAVATASPAATEARTVGPSPTQSPTRSPQPAASAAATPAPAAIGARVAVGTTQYLTVERVEHWAGRSPTPGRQYVSALVLVEAVEAGPYNDSYFSVDTEAGRVTSTALGKPPRFPSAGSLAQGEQIHAWVTFSVPDPCACELAYSIPIGNGERSDPVRVRLDPIGPATPDPTPTPRPTFPPAPTPAAPTPAAPHVAEGLPELVSFDGSFFGPNVTVETYSVTGTTLAEISASMEANGPWSPWIGGAATAVTKPETEFDIDFSTSASGECVLVTGDPPVSTTYTVVMPAWTPPAGTTATTVEAWNEMLLEVAIHERTHVEIVQRGVDTLVEAVPSSGCDTVEALIDEVMHEVEVENCEFDLAEYGTELGLSMESCLAGLSSSTTAGLLLVSGPGFAPPARRAP